MGKKVFVITEAENFFLILVRSNLNFIYLVKMWYEILPSFGIITGLLFLSTPAHAILNKLYYDNFYQRELKNPDQLSMYVRDMRLTGAMRRMKGLDSIPDEPESN